MNDALDITLIINGRNYPLRVEPRRTLLDAIRDECGLTGTHTGCEHGVSAAPVPCWSMAIPSARA